MAESEMRWSPAELQGTRDLHAPEPVTPVRTWCVVCGAPEGHYPCTVIMLLDEIERLRAALAHLADWHRHTDYVGTPRPDWCMVAAGMSDYARAALAETQ